MVRMMHVVAALASLALASATSAGPPPPGFSDRIHVRFAEGADVSPPTDALSPALAASVSTIVKLFTLPAGTLNALTAVREDLPDLNLWFEITLNVGVDPGDFLEQLRALASVDVAEFAPLVPPDPAVTPSFVTDQGYLGPAPDGIDAEFAWTIPGGNGAGITIYDVERTWNQNHEDLSKAAGVALLLAPGDSVNQPNNNHGTAVLGELIADNDAKGVTGISFGADVGLAPTITTNLGLNVANAILLATADAKAGDVILMETQTAVCDAGPCDVTQVGCGPSEWSQAVFDAIQTAVANRITVVEAGGNGNVNLDQASCNSRFDRTQRDSGAIIVGAGGPAGGTTDRRRLDFSSYGSRVDVQAWGGGVVTTAYGDSYMDPDDPTNANRWYTDTFGGTSSASPMVAGAVANLQGIALQRFGTPLLPFQLRLLLQETGSPQLGDTTQNIGPRPDLQGAIARLTEGAIDLFILVDLSGSFADDLVNFKAQAPSIVNGIRAANPNVRFGLAKFEDYPISPFGHPDPARGDTAYERILDLTFDTATLLDAIANLPTPIDGDGGDEPQSQLPALFQAASGAGHDLSGQGFPGASIPMGQQANFRGDGATKLFLLWTDAAFHLPGDAGDIPYPGPSFVETVAAIQALDPPQVIGISSGPAGVTDLEAMAQATGALAPMGGVDCDGNGMVDIAEGEPLVCEIAPSGAGIAEAITRLVQAVVAASTPVARCKDVETTTDPGVCGATVSVDDGSFDPDGGPVTLFQSPQGPYPVGQSAVTLKVTDATGLTDFCVATVTVVDDELPVPMCNATPITPPDAPHSFMATATDNCAVGTEITEFDCFKFTNKGKRVDKTGSCDVSIAGDSLTISDTGGVGDHISWTVVATDENGNVAQTGCEVVVGNPGKGKP